MRPQFILRILLQTIFVFIFNTADASHQVGGEITWTCQGNGYYKFRFVFYNDCYQISPGTTLTMETTVNLVPTISLTLIQNSGLPAPGFQSNGATVCATCATAGSTQPQAGIYGEYIYESSPVQLPGLPPAGGWKFTVGDCCRPNYITNIPNSGILWLESRAIMYPYNGRIAGQCNDNSPFFVEKPQAAFCTGQKTSYSYAAEDVDRDDLIYSWASPLDYQSAVINYGPGYTVNNPFPGPAMNPNNTITTLNQRTGLVEFTSFTGGAFNSVGKVTAYKCGEKVAEIFRDFIIVLKNNCPPVFSSQPNHNPQFNAPFIDLTTGLQTSYIDTVSPGDTVSIFFNGTDFDTFTNGSFQTLTLEGYSVQFGNNFTDPNVGCLTPPCAFLSGSLPATNNISISRTFKWPITCAHVADDSTCTGNYTTYRFWLRIRDNYCLGNGAVSVPFLIIVSGAAITNDTSATTLCITGSPVPLTATPQGGTWSGTGVTGNFFDPALAGAGVHEVTYTVTDSSGCQSSDKIEFTVNTCTGVFQSALNHQVVIKQDDVSGLATVVFAAPHRFTDLNVYDINGKLLLNTSVSEVLEKTIPMASFQPGVYIFRIIGKDEYLNEKVVRY